jgi:hypothetical protein
MSSSASPVARELSREASGVGERVETNIAAWFLPSGKGAGHVWLLSYGRPIWAETAAELSELKGESEKPQPPIEVPHQISPLYVLRMDSVKNA